jgi:hypothetical protein
MTQRQHTIPRFKNSQEAAAWWDTHDVTEYVEELEPVRVQFDLKKSQEETVVFRLHAGVKQYLENVAKNKGLNLSSLLRMWVMEKIQTGHS